MKKSKIVSYTSEELKQMPDESDWDAVANMTDEEIEAAIASDPEEAALHERWLERIKPRQRKPRFIMCINNQGHRASLTLRRVYKVIPDEKAEQDKMIRVVDDTGKDYLFPASCFVPVQLPVEAEQSFDLVVV